MSKNPLKDHFRAPLRRLSVESVIPNTMQYTQVELAGSPEGIAA